MPGPAAPRIVGTSFGKGVLITIQSNLPYQGLNGVSVLWNTSAGFRTSRVSREMGLYSNRFYYEALSSSTWTGTRYLRLYIRGQGDDDDSPQSNEISFTIDRTADDPALPDPPSFTLKGIDQGIRVCMGGLSQPVDGPDFQYVDLSHRPVVSHITQRLAKPDLELDSVFSGDRTFTSYIPSIKHWSRSWTPEDGWTEWSDMIESYGRGGSGPDLSDYDGLTSAFNATDCVTAASASRICLYVPSINRAIYNRVTGVNIETAYVEGIAADLLPSSYRNLIPSVNRSSLNINNVPALVAQIRTHGRILNVLLSGLGDVWVYEGSGAIVGQVQDWSTRNPDFPQGFIDLQSDQTIDTVRPESIDRWGNILVTGDDFDVLPDGFGQSDKGFLRTVENQNWSTAQAVTRSEEIIDGLTNGEDYEVAGAIHSWDVGPYARATGTAGGGMVNPPVLSVPDPALGHDSIVIPIEVESEEKLREICIEYRGSLIIGMQEAPWRTLICKWKGGVFVKDGFTPGSMIDLRVTAKTGPPLDPDDPDTETATMETSVTKRGIVVGYTEEAEQIFPGWFDRPYEGDGNLYRLTGTLFDKADGWKQWVPRSIELSLDAEYEEFLATVGGRLRGLWVNGRYYGRHDQVEHHVAVTVEGVSFDGLATYRSNADHTASSDNRPTGLGTTTWTLVRLPASLSDSAPSPQPGIQDAELPEPTGVDIVYNRAISETSVGELAFVNRRGEYKFGYGSGAAYVPANWNWEDVKAATRLSMAQMDKFGIDQSRLLQSLVYAAAEESGEPERIIAMFDGGTRRVEMAVTGGRRSINGERVTIGGQMASFNEDGGTHDLVPDRDVTFRVFTDDYPVDNQVTNEALPPNIIGGSLMGVPSAGQIVATWQLPASGNLTNVRVYVRRVIGKGLGLLALLPPTATTHTFKMLPAGSYFLYALTQNAAGISSDVAAKAGPFNVT